MQFHLTFVYIDIYIDFSIGHFSIGLTSGPSDHSLDEAPYKLSEAVTQLVGITFSLIRPPTGLITLVL
jgi:hypothetical protein